MSCLRIACITLLLFSLAACRGAPDDATAARLPHPVAGAEVNDAIAGTREVLQAAGIHVASERQLLGLALDARRKQHQMRLDSAEFAQMLKAFGFPFEASGGTYVGEDRLMQGLLEREDRQAWEQLEADAMREAHHARQAVDAERKALSERHAAERNALRDEARQREREAMAVRDALRRERSAAPAADKAAITARLVDAENAVSQARKRMGEVNLELREMSRVHRAAEEALGAEAVLERRVAGAVGRDARAGRELMALLGEWVRQAQAQPDHPDSAVPLFLASMALQQADPVDLAADPDPHRHRWSLLEMLLFASAFQPADGKGPASDSASALATLASVLVPPARAYSPCEVAKEAWGSWGDPAQSVNGKVSNVLLEHALETKYGADFAKNITDKMAATSILGKIVKLAAFYSNTQVTVEGEVSQLHKPLGGYKKVAFTARAGVSAEELEAYRQAEEATRDMDQATKNCLGWAGLPTFDSIADVAKEADTWLLDWRLYGNGHANWALRDNEQAKYLGSGRVALGMKRTSPSSVESRFVVRMLGEPAHTGPMNEDQVVVSAEVDSSSMPSLSTLTSAMASKLGLGVAESIVDIAAGWTRVVFKPRAYAVVDMEFHCPNPTTIHHYARNAIADGSGDDGCTFEFQTREDFEKWKKEHGIGV